PCGLGAAYRLLELGHDHFSIVEKNDYIGGLSASFADEQGFTWDIGGHVIHSHYDYFDQIFSKLMRNEYYSHQRSAWIYQYERWIPYPFQNNIRHLPKQALLECLAGLIAAQQNEGSSTPRNFAEWVRASFGAGIAEHFMLPYNQKVWATHPHKMDFKWIGERVSLIDLHSILSQVILEQDTINWGPNNTFLFPKKGGTGGFFSRFVPIIAKQLRLKTRVVTIDCIRKTVTTSQGEQIHYDQLVSTMPLDILIKQCALEKLSAPSRLLRHSDATIVGLGIKGAPPVSLADKSWVYFPEPEHPYYRMTVFSNYAKSHSPTAHYSLMFEISYPARKRPDEKELVSKTVRAAIQAGFIKDKQAIVDIYSYPFTYSYPVPTLQRDEALRIIQPALEKRQIYSRGRFGAWRYEIGNMDHCFMQGKEIVDRLLVGTQERTCRLR
ncbi:MAG TPA: FAD-dependent oxidoreductase, partial [bacterium]|nr:FAD-dependent oxidoreductase [bacterium]